MIETPVIPNEITPVITGTGLLKTIELKVEKEFTFLFTELTPKQKDFIISHKSQKTLDIASDALGFDCSNIVLIGSSAKINTANAGKYMGFFLGPDTGKQYNIGNFHPHRDVHYRDYGYTLERQEKSSWLINICPDLRMSVNSLKRRINSEYCCIWKRRN